jgi:general secretion pathway protein M
MENALPEGRRGRLLALALTLSVLAALWLGCARPLIDWYGAQSEVLGQRRALLQHMTQVAATLPTLQRQSSGERPPPASLLEGASDAIAGAALQDIVQAMGAAAGASFSSIETLPAEQRGAYRRIGLRLSLAAPWPVLIELLRAAETGAPRAPGVKGAAVPAMLIDDLQLRAPPLQLRAAGAPVTASFTILAFRAAPEGKPDAKARGDSAGASQ